jgi:hypothetical protein
MADELKAAGNAAFSKKDYEAACTKYTEAIAASKDGALRVSCLSNRAACHLKLSNFQKSVDDCTEVLKSEPSHTKALYRRAQAYEGLDDLTSAFKDVRRLLSLDRKNKPAITLATKLKEAIQREALGVGKALSSATDPNASAKARADAARGIAARASEPPFASEFVLRGGIKKLWEQCGDIEAVLRVLGSVVEHKHLSSIVVQQLDLQKIGAMVEGGDRALAKAAIRFLTHATKRVADDGGSESDAKRVRAVTLRAYVACLRMRGDTQAEVQVKNKALEEQHEEIAALQGAALDGAVQVLTSQQATMEFTQLGGLQAAFDLGDCRDRQVCTRLTLVNCRALQGFGSEEAVRAQVAELCTNSLQKEDKDSQLKGCSMLGCLFMVYPSIAVDVLGTGSAMGRLCLMAQCGVPWIQSLAIDIMAQAAATESGRRLFSAPVLETLQALLSGPSQAVVAGAASVVAKMTLSAKAFDAETPDGMRLLNAALDNLKRRPDQEQSHPGAKGVEERGVETLCSMISNNDVKEEVAHGVGMKQLVALAKLVNDEHMESKRKQDTMGIFLPSHPGAGKNKKGDKKKDDKEEGANKSTLAFGLAHVFSQLTVTERELKAIALRGQELDVDQYEELQKLQNMHLEKQRAEQGLPAPIEDEDSDQLCVERCAAFVDAGGVTALVHLAHEDATPKVRDMIGQTLVHVAKAEKARGQIVAQGGLKLLLKLISLETKDDALNKDSGDKEDDDGLEAPQVAAAEKEKSGIAAMLAQQKRRRGKNKGDDKKDEKRITQLGVQDCQQAVARLLISTNPHLLPAAQQMDAVAALLPLTDSQEQLNQFEACMALTNLASCSDEVRDNMVTKSAVRKLVYLMFSDHELVQRASTEAMCNLIQHPVAARQVMAQQNPGVKLWVALSENWEEEMLTARAACGTLVSMAQMEGLVDEAYEKELEEKMKNGAKVEDVEKEIEEKEGRDSEKDEAKWERFISGPKKLIEAGACGLFVDILNNSGDNDMEHRAVVAMQCMCEAREEKVAQQCRQALLTAKALPACLKMGKRSKGKVSQGVMGALKAVITMLNEERISNKDNIDYSVVDEEAEVEEAQSEVVDTNFAETEEQAQMAKLLAKLGEKLSEAEQSAIVEAEAPEDKARLLQAAIAAHPEVEEELRAEAQAEMDADLED